MPPPPTTTTTHTQGPFNIAIMGLNKQVLRVRVKQLRSQDLKAQFKTAGNTKATRNATALAPAPAPAPSKALKAAAAPSPAAAPELLVTKAGT